MRPPLQVIMRVLGGMECFLHRMHEKNGFGDVYWIWEVDASYSFEDVRDAGHRVVEAFPQLRSAVRGGRFITRTVSGRLPLRWIGTSSNITDTVEDLLCMFREFRGPWLAYFVEGRDEKHLVILMNHAFTDGKGLVNMGREWAAVIRHGAGGGCKLGFDLGPTVEHVVDTRRHTRCCVRWPFVWLRWPWTHTPKPTHLLVGSPKNIIVSEQTSAPSVLAACRVHGTTVTAIVAAVALKAIRRRMPGAGFLRLMCDTMVSVRPTAQASAMGMYVSYIDTIQEVAPDQDAWVLARKYKTDIDHQDMDRLAGQLLNVRLLGWTSGLVTKALCVSSMGVVDVSPGVLGAPRFGISVVGGPHWVFLGVTTHMDVLYVTLTASSAKVGPAALREVAGDLVRELEAIV